MAIPALVSAASAISQSGQQQQAASTQGTWTRYNAQMGYNTTVGNIRSQMNLTRVNAMFAMRAGAAQTGVIAAQARYNAQMIYATTMYNDELLERELELMWDGTELTLEQLEDQRAVERGAIVANQAASGTVIGEGSNAEVIIDQKTQEAMDAFIIRHNADIQASNITNARTQGLWQGQAQSQRVIFEGQLQAASVMNNAIASAAGGLATSAISGMANLKSADYALRAGMSQGDIYQMQGNQAAQNNLFQGLFSAAGQGISAYYAQARTPSLMHYNPAGSFRAMAPAYHGPGTSLAT